ncbi:hypothetical protein [Mucilaginibacter flavus]|uniref:hypothetical protein n=1 Tax=Mucilaginibacter flavus TaxID=931504 RepID=UPI0025B62741|nr:hypothetical protein [Mucilaginibacter flavus]
MLFFSRFRGCLSLFSIQNKQLPVFLLVFLADGGKPLRDLHFLLIPETITHEKKLQEPF